ncbi:MULTISPECIES: PilX N-terminal domain-containing pilus assembly protein [Eikenella]|uniref:Pilus assembly protein PilX n=1 Tax=Eikenella longinqua TaxID=1795827 RepID=A0A1A9S195_9NEIS|nr:MULTISPECIES: PilX N-terminal domain-containing pilus assembly protein [Eikenella]OAM31200.1 hypothetical protein A7P95_01520 [Eikenella longinqua]
MRQSILKKNQGYTLFIVLIMMLVIAVIVVASMQSTNTEMRISSNEADRKYAFSLAEQALRAGEQRIVEVKNQAFDKVTNSTECKDGICGEKASENTPVWKRTDTVNLNENGKGRHCLNTGTKNINNACYMVERLGETADSRYAHVFRVTARAWGANENTVVTLQSYAEYSGK